MEKLDYDLVFVVGNGSKYNNVELRIALRSVARYVPHRKIFLVGAKPDWVNYDLVTHIPAEDPYKDGLPDDVQAELTARYKELLQIFYDKRDKIDRVTFWGLHDSMSWKNDYPIPRRTNYPLLFNRDLTPKPAVEAILSIPD